MGFYRYCYFNFPHFCLLELGETLKLTLFHKTKKTTTKDKESNYALSSLVMFAQIN